MWPNLSFPEDMVIFTDQIFNPNKSEVFEGSSFSAGVKFDLPFIFRK